MCRYASRKFRLAHLHILVSAIFLFIFRSYYPNLVNLIA